MKLFSLILLVACVALVGCQKAEEPAAGGSASTNAPAK